MCAHIMQRPRDKFLDFLLVSPEFILLLPATSDAVFPPEVFEIIIVKLAGDLATLRSCALVSWTFYSLTRLFSRLQIGPRANQGHTLAKLCELLEGSPFFTARLRLCQEWTESYGSWILEADLGRCLSLLGSVTCLAIKGSCWSYRPAWLKFSGANRDSVHAILPLTLLSHWLSLCSLTLADVTFAEASNLVVVVTIKLSRVRLRHLCLHVHPSLAGGFLGWVTSQGSPVDTSCLSSLECTVQHLDDYVPPDPAPLGRFGAKSATSMHRQLLLLFLLSFPNVDAHYHYKLDLHKLGHLHTLIPNTWLDIVKPPDRQRLLSLGRIALLPLQKLALVLNR
ncbi:hypothetical protein MSAN_01228100 [Mycena sanguinolenta]|uniref:Uncharacterized protein n=1 Tax=Mycena sanguinolenta TaxID=230812 RepID=A0A8H6YIJ1_9AGAR|nr:hypothetical protein MSAN_01228100 [Mycena sanguinolenta]